MKKNRRFLRPFFLLLLLLLSLAPVSAGEAITYVKDRLAPVFREPSEHSEQVTQVLMGDSVNVLRVRGGWAEVVVPQQYRTSSGYPGWVQMRHLVKSYSPDTGYVTVAYPLIHLREKPAADSESMVTAYLSTRLPLADRPAVAGWVAVRLPWSDEVLWARENQVKTEFALSRGQGKTIADRARLFKGTPYLWGGMSEQGIDCAGLVYTVYRLHGITVPRDADQQALVGEKVSKEQLEPGDMVFFGKSSDDITHVGLYAGDGKIVHASSGVGVTESRLFQGW